MERGVFECTVEDATGIEIDVSSSLFDDEKSDGEEGGEDDAHGGTAFDFAELGDPLGEEGGEDSGDGGADEHSPAGAGAGDEEGDGEAGENGVADGVTHHAHATKEKEGAGKGAGHGTQHADGDDVEVVDVHGRVGAWLLGLTTEGAEGPEG